MNSCGSTPANVTFWTYWLVLGSHRVTLITPSSSYATIMRADWSKQNVTRRAVAGSGSSNTGGSGLVTRSHSPGCVRLSW